MLCPSSCISRAMKQGCPFIFSTESRFQNRQRTAERPKYGGGKAESCVPMLLHPDQFPHNHAERGRHAHMATSEPSCTARIMQSPHVLPAVAAVLDPQCSWPEKHHLKHKATRCFPQLKAAGGSLGMGTYQRSWGNVHQLLRGGPAGPAGGPCAGTGLWRGLQTIPKSTVPKPGRAHQLSRGGGTSKEAEVREGRGYQERRRQLRVLQEDATKT